MKQLSICAAITLAFAGGISPASAQGVSPDKAISYVSRNGGGSTCSKTSPCATFTTAFATTYSEGSIICLDAGDYGALIIDRSINIDCTAALGHNGSRDTAVSGLPTAAFTINVPGQTSSVSLRGLSTTLSRAVIILAAKVVSIEDCVFAGTFDIAIWDRRTAGQTRLYVRNTIIRNYSNVGIVAASQSPASTVLDNVSLLNNGYGLAVAPGNNVVVTRSTISGNTTAGIHADGGSQINLLNSVLSHNTANMNAYGTIRLQENTIQFSNVAIQGSGARSLGANRFAGNVTLGSTPPLVSGAPADVYD